MQLNHQLLSFLVTFVIMFALAPSVLAQTATQRPHSDSELPEKSGRGRAVSRVFPAPQAASPRSYNTVTRLAPINEPARETSKTVTHLQRAAEHLAAAGKTKLAKQISREAVLAAKLEQIQKLQAEMDEIRATAGANRTVILNVKIMELQVSKMKRLGVDLKTGGTVDLEALIGGTTVKLEAVNELISALQKNNLIKIISEPTLATISGRPATFVSGVEIPFLVPATKGRDAVVETRLVGTRLDCVAKLLERDRIRVELNMSVTSIDTSKSTVIQGSTVPGLRTWQISTAVLMEAGQTIAWSGMRQARGPNDSSKEEETALLMTITVNLGKPVATAQKKAKIKRR